MPIGGLGKRAVPRFLDCMRLPEIPEDEEALEKLRNARRLAISLYFHRRRCIHLALCILIRIHRYICIYNRTVALHVANAVYRGLYVRCRGGSGASAVGQPLGPCGALDGRAVDTAAGG